MISLVSGEIAALSSSSAVVIVGGIGLEVFLTPRHLINLKTGQSASFHTRLIVREDDLSLFGFQSAREREIFDELNSVSGIGPKLALTVLAGMDADQVVEAVNSQDEASFRAIPGVGPKTAKLILISLGGKVTASSADPKQGRVLAALTQLGTDELKARKTLGDLPKDLDESELLKRALAVLGSDRLR